MRPERRREGAGGLAAAGAGVQGGGRVAAGSSAVGTFPEKREKASQDVGRKYENFPFSFTFPGGAPVKNSLAHARDERDVGSILGQEDPLVKEVATCSSIFSLRIPWTEEPGGLPSLGSQ